MAVLNGNRASGTGTCWSWLIEKFHESHERHDIGRIHAPHVETGFIFRRSVGRAVRVFLALVRKILIGDAHFDVIGLAREYRERLVLRLPAEAGHGAIAAR